MTPRCRAAAARHTGGRIDAGATKATGKLFDGFIVKMIGPPTPDVNEVNCL
jgi:hypothetical protein